MSYNKVILAGIVKEKPTIRFVPELGKTINIKLEINRKDIAKKEIVTIMSTNEDLMKEVLMTVHVGDYCSTINAKIITTNYEKNLEVICSHCQNVSYVRQGAERTDIEFYDFATMKLQEDQEVYGINKVIVMGAICSDLNYRTAQTTKSYIKYKLAIDRNGRSKIIQPADYPFIVSFGQEADTANTYLARSSIVLIEGAIQEREIKQKVTNTCSACGNALTIKKESIVREIITSKVKYISKKSKDSDIAALEGENE